jgi:flagellar basal body-associated protein FliL
MELLSPGKDDRLDEERENIELELADDEDAMEEDESHEPASDKDVSDIEQMLEMDTESEADSMSDEIELEFDVDGKPGREQEKGLGPDTTFVDEKESIMTEDQLAEEDAVKAAGKKVDVKKAKPAKAKKKISTPVVILIVIVLIACAAAGGYFLLESQGVKLPSIKELNIPYIRDLLTPDSKKDLGAVEAVQSNVKSEFVDNSTLGKLFVISGQVKNTTSKTHHSVKVTAKLYAIGKKLAKSKTVYAGNKLTMEELASGDLIAINQRQANPLSSSGQPIRIKPGEILPFMIVIPNLPDNLEEYKVMVSESIPE